MTRLLLPQLCIPAVFALALISLLWVARDARKRGRSALWVALLCLITWPLGLAIWRSVRPPPPV